MTKPCDVQCAVSALVQAFSSGSPGGHAGYNWDIGPPTARGGLETRRFSQTIGRSCFLHLLLLLSSAPYHLYPLTTLLRLDTTRHSHPVDTKTRPAQSGHLASACLHAPDTASRENRRPSPCFDEQCLLHASPPLTLVCDHRPAWCDDGKSDETGPSFGQPTGISTPVNTCLSPFIVPQDARSGRTALSLFGLSHSRSAVNSSTYDRSSAALRRIVQLVHKLRPHPPMRS